MNHKNARILKLLSKGLTPEQIVKKLGYQNKDEGLKRVDQAIKNQKT